LRARSVRRRGLRLLGAIFSYVAGAPFALENVYGLSPTLFGLAFGVNGLGLIIASHVNGRLVSRFGPMRLFTVGAVALAAGSIGLLIVVASHVLGLLARRPGTLAEAVPPLDCATEPTPP
jgi:predicted MFS family arabinose efflux permease